MTKIPVLITSIIFFVSLTNFISVSASETNNPTRSATPFQVQSSAGGIHNDNTTEGAERRAKRRAQILGPRNCYDIHRNRRGAIGGIQEHAIYPNGPDEPGVYVFCDFETDGGGWTIIQQRSSGPREEFYRNWTEYEDGFGDENFWIGLKTIHALTAGKNQELRIELQDWLGERRYAKFSEFHIANASDSYRLTIEGFSGDAGYGVPVYSGLKFSTKDRDNDLWEGGNLAEMFPSGWWHSSGAPYINLNGLYREKEESFPVANGVIWYDWRGYNYSLKKTEMKIRNRSRRPTYNK